MNRHFHHNGLAGLLIVGLFLLTGIIVSARQLKTSESDVRKADYIFLEALRQKAAGNNDAYFELLEAAYNLNPADKYIAMQEGTRRLVTHDPADTSDVEIIKALDLIHDYVAANPSDVYAGMVFAQLSNRMGRPDDAIATWEAMYNSDSQRSDIAMNYVDALMASDDSTNRQKALALLDTIERAEGIMPDVSMRRMRVFESKNDTAAVMVEARKLLDSSPNDVNYLIFTGRLFTEYGQPDSALKFFNRAIEVDPESGTAYYNRAMFYNQTGDSVAYDREVNQIIRMSDLDIEPKLEILKDYTIRLYQDSMQRDRITGLFQSFIDLNPHEPEVRKLYADYLIAIRDYAGAAEQKSYELDIDPSDSQGWIMLTSLYMQISDPVKSKKAAMRGIHYFPDETPLYVLAAANDVQNDSLESALKIYKKAIAITDSTNLEDLSNIYSGIGDVYYKLNQLDSMARYYDLAVLYNPSNLTALNNYAYYISCMENGDLDHAYEMIEKVMALDGENPTTMDTYAWVLFKRKDYVKAREIIDKVLEQIEDPSADVFDHAGDIYFMDGDPEKAVEYWSEALKLAPDNELIKKKVKHKTFFYK